MQRWLSNAQLDRFVLKAVKATAHTACHLITAMTQYLLYEEGVIMHGQKFPTEEEVYVSLLRLMQKRDVDRYVDLPTGGIRYRARVYSGLG